MSYSLDDAHEALAVIECELGGLLSDQGSYGGYCAAILALMDIEADLPEPCEECGSDQPADGCVMCEEIHPWH